jgi:hypothetical protein
MRARRGHVRTDAQANFFFMLAKPIDDARGFQLRDAGHVRPPSQAHAVDSLDQGAQRRQASGLEALGQ